MELQSWPTFNFDGDPGSCPFDIKGKEGEINKEIKENKEKYFNSNISKVTTIILNFFDLLCAENGFVNAFLKSVTQNRTLHMLR